MHGQGDFIAAVQAVRAAVGVLLARGAVCLRADGAILLVDSMAVISSDVGWRATVRAAPVLTFRSVPVVLTQPTKT